jgi:hypothetical protein
MSDPCEMEYAALARNGACNVPKQCSAGDWDDCGAPQAASEGAGKLLNVVSPSVDVLIRNCTALNLTVQSQGMLGVVDTVFDPPLDTSSMRMVSPPGRVLFPITRWRVAWRLEIRARRSAGKVATALRVKKARTDVRARHVQRRIFERRILLAWNMWAELHEERLKTSKVLERGLNFLLKWKLPSRCLNTWADASRVQMHTTMLFTRGMSWIRNTSGSRAFAAWKFAVHLASAKARAGATTWAPQYGPRRRLFPLPSQCAGPATRLRPCRAKQVFLPCV